MQLFQRVPEQSGAGSILEQKLGRSVQAIAYPYGDPDAIVQHLMEAYGYLGLSC